MRSIMPESSRVYVSVSKRTTTVGIIQRELDRIEALTGSRPIDWMYEIHDIAVRENETPCSFDFDGFEMQVSCDADQYIDFVLDNYPEAVSC